MRKSKVVALGGLMAALSIVIMCFGGMMPFMTYVSPVLRMTIGAILLKLIGKTGFISWYFAVMLLSLLLCPDKEAAAVFTAFGYYPLSRVYLQRLPFKWLFKMIYFNAVTLLLYWVLMHILGMQQLYEEFAALGMVMTLVILFAGNLVFVLFDVILLRLERSHKYRFKMDEGR